MVDAIVADLATGLLRKALSLAAEELIQAWGLQENLEHLQNRLELVHDLLSDADAKQVTIHTVRRWLNKLRDVADDADLLLEDLNYQVLRQKALALESHGKVRDFISHPKTSILYRFKMSHKIKDINASLDNIYKEAADIGLKPLDHLNASPQRNEIRLAPPKVYEPHIVGRTDDESKFINMLLENNGMDLSVIAVVGLGGLGKTTLARMVYDSPEVEMMNRFQQKVWVTVSDEFDVMRILNDIVQSLTQTNPQYTSQEAAVKMIQKDLMGKTFLLVLDDVWNTDSNKWNCLHASLLTAGGNGSSKIIVTTRGDEVVSAMQSSSTCRVLPYKLSGLSFHDSWQLFSQRVFGEDGVPANDCFKGMGKTMVERCSGLPLAVQTLASLLLLPSPFPALTILAIVNFDGLEALPDSLGNLSSLRYLYIINCKKLERLPTMDVMHHRLSNLQGLTISWCPLLEERCAKDTGPEWHKISHIPRFLKKDVQRTLALNGTRFPISHVYI